MSWGVGIRFAYQLHILPVEEPVAIKALNSDFRLICKGMKKIEEQDGKGEERITEKEEGENQVRRDEGAEVTGERLKGGKDDGTRNVRENE